MFFLAEQLSPECQQSVTPARDRWFESVSLQRRVSCEPDRDLGRNAPRHTRFTKANCVPCDISISLLTSPDRSGKTSESAEDATQRARHWADPLGHNPPHANLILIFQHIFVEKCVSEIIRFTIMRVGS